MSLNFGGVCNERGGNTIMSWTWNGCWTMLPFFHGFVSGARWKLMGTCSARGWRYSPRAAVEQNSANSGQEIFHGTSPRWLHIRGRISSINLHDCEGNARFANIFINASLIRFAFLPIDRRCGSGVGFRIPTCNLCPCVFLDGKSINRDTFRRLIQNGWHNDNDNYMITIQIHLHLLTCCMIPVSFYWISEDDSDDT